MSNKEESCCVISKEMLLLLRWLCEHDSTMLKKMIARACSRGFVNHLKSEQEEVLDSDVTNEIVFDFFNVLEDHLAEAQVDHEDKLCKATKSGYAKQLSKIDCKQYDSDMLLKTLDITSSYLKNNPSESPKDVFLKEFLKAWRSKDNIVN